MDARRNFRSELERDSFQSFWQNKLSSILSTLGRLAYLSSLRGPFTGRYAEPSLREQFGEEEADRVLRLAHVFTFQQWLAYTLEEQKADVELYFSMFGGQRGRLVELWLKLETSRSLIPESAREEEKRLYLWDLRMVLELIARQAGGG